MAKNTKTYVLLGIVLIIWGAIGYQLFSGLNPSDPEITLREEIVRLKPQLSTVKDTFNIIADYRDPFLGDLPKKKKVVRLSKPKIIVPAIEISYTGSVIGSQQKNSIFFVTIEGVAVLLKPKQTLNGVTLVSGSEKNIKIRHEGKLRTIPLQ